MFTEFNLGRDRVSKGCAQDVECVVGCFEHTGVDIRTSEVI